MNSKHWLNYFTQNRLGRPEPDWGTATTVSKATARSLARSFSHFQLGESGEGRFLLAQARRAYPEEREYAAALELFLAEEREHARLLSRLVERFGGALIMRHWTHSIFRAVRRSVGVRFEIQVLVIAEIVGAAYYQLIAAHVDDPAVHDACALILRDEVQHLAFHGERFASEHAGWLPIELAAWSIQFQTMLLLATRVAWLDHRAALTQIGVTRSRFFHEARLGCIAFLRNLAAVCEGKNSAEAALDGSRCES